MKFDDASWHYGGDYPEGQPEEHGGTHIALFLKWCFIKGWAGELHMQNEPEAVQAVIDGTMSATDFLFQYCDGKLIDEMLSETGNAFAKLYYGDDGLYLADYANNFDELMYVKPEATHDFVKFSAILDARLKSGVLTKEQLKSKPWWKVW
ncbi:DUF7832 domain-containing protein [Shewanella cyperi]|uniref:DUF7832 domain-containing protein n=1 Tax=Shewanella cyperi TaxID=2814292 RepID=A0A975AJ46_9GAMM|nr:hypothetical protein [Shewanella cyperi]QSX28710.1 hypothetical protein JYB88_10470 [Shewanella cyperi]QSX39457.1 hypothetical protein JYB84_10385 [Shewanella cyperi]